jgi:hypothetical protein
LIGLTGKIRTVPIIAVKVAPNIGMKARTKVITEISNAYGNLPIARTMKNIELRISILKYLGYQIGINVVGKDAREKDVTTGKRKEKRIQITPKYDYAPVAQCVVWGI